MSAKKNVLLETEQATEANVEPTKLESRSFGNASIIAEWLADDEKQREVVVYTLPDGKTIAVVDARTRASKNLTADATHQNKPVAEAFQSDLANILKYVCAGNEERFGVIWDTREGYPDIIKRFGNNKPNAPRTYFVTDVFSNVVDSKNLTDEMRAACPPETPVVLIIGQVTKKMQLAQLSLLQNTSIAALRRSGAGSV